MIKPDSIRQERISDLPSGRHTTLSYMKKNLQKRLLCCLTAAMPLFCLWAETLPYQNPELSFEARAEDLVSRLTLSEKIGLMQDQSKAVNRLGIEGFGWWNEALHGVARFGYATVFPQAIGMAATFDDEALLRTFTAVSDEGRAKSTYARRIEGKHGKYNCVTYWTPNINIFRDPRWGRGQETYGEDPYLTSQMGLAVVRGLQGPDDSHYAKAYACAKHFAVHSGPEWNRHSFNAADIESEDLWETYLPAFKALVQEGNVKQVMCAYNRYEGKPCCGSDALLIDILRNKWGYQHYVVSDCGAIDDFFKSGRHETHPDSAHAAADAVLKGTDLECGRIYRSLPDAVRRGLVTEAQLDINLKRLMKARFELGDFDPDSIVEWAQIPMSVVNCQEHKDLALEMARKSMVLLQNKQQVLPLAKSAEGLIVMGNNAKDSVMQWGNYNGNPYRTITIYDGICQKLNRKLPYVECPLIYEEDIKAYVANTMAGLPACKSVIFVGGISPALEGEQMRVDYAGFKGGDRTTIELPAIQREMIAALKAAGKTIIFVNCSGSAIALTPESENCAAILQAWYSGEAGGTAVADVLFGDYNPSGRLPVTFYKSDAQLPDYQDYSMKGRTYRFMQEEPLFAFGHGLSYTSFEYGKPSYDKKTHSLRVKIKNTGKRDGDEIVQLYVQRLGEQESAKALRGFKRVFIPAGKSLTISFPIDEKSLAFYDKNAGDLSALNTNYRLFLGGASDQLQSIEIAW